jgi:hypothetical protein
MITFAVVAMLALAVVKLVDVLCDYVPGTDTHIARTVLTYAASLAAVWLLDFSMFAGFEVPVRDDAVGVWLTGFVVAGMTVPWRALFGFLTHDRATIDETLGNHRPRLAA